MSARVRSFALFGETTGRCDEHGLPIRLDWTADYRGQALVVFGHTPTPEPVWCNNTVNIDTGCTIFGGRLVERLQHTPSARSCRCRAQDVLRSGAPVHAAGGRGGRGNEECCVAISAGDIHVWKPYTPAGSGGGV